MQNRQRQRPRPPPPKATDSEGASVQTEAGEFTDSSPTTAPSMPSDGSKWLKLEGTFVGVRVACADPPTMGSVRLAGPEPPQAVPAGSEGTRVRSLGCDKEPRGGGMVGPPILLPHGSALGRILAGWLDCGAGLALG